MYWRLRPSAAALARGFVRLPGSDGAGGFVRLPVSDTPPLLFASIRNAPPAIDPAEGGFETVAVVDRLTAAARRRFTSLGRSILHFGAQEVFPEGTRDQTRRYRKQLAFARRAGLALDGPFVRQHPELLEGFAPIAAPAAVDAP